MKPFSAELYELRRAAAAMQQQCASALDGVKAALPALSASDDPNTAIAAATATAAVEVRVVIGMRLCSHCEETRGQPCQCRLPHTMSVCSRAARLGNVKLEWKDST